MSVSAPKIVAKREAEISREEWDARVQLAACYRIFDLLGWTEYIFNHITLRVPGPERHFLINPFGLVVPEAEGVDEEVPFRPGNAQGDVVEDVLGPAEE